MPQDPVCADRAAEPTTPLLDGGVDGLRIAVAGGYFSDGCFPGSGAAIEPRRHGAQRAQRDRIARGCAGPRRGLRHHRDRRRSAASRPPAHPGARFRSRGARPADRRRHAARRRWWCRRRNSAAGIASRCSNCSQTRRDPGAGHALHGAAIGQQTFILDGVECRCAPNHGHLHPADLLYWFAGGGRAGAACRRCRSACRSSPRPGAKTSPCASPRPWRTQGVVRWRRGRTFREKTDGHRSAGRRRRSRSGLRPLRKGAGRQRRRRRSTRMFRDDRSHHPLRRHGESVRLWRDQGVSRRALAGRARAHAVEHDHHHVSGAISPSPRPCTTAPRRRARSAGRCRPG